MASNKDPSIPTDNKASIALLRHLRAGGHDVHFVHRIDVCTAPPELLVADLEPVPGTGLEDDGYSRVWYLYHAKKFTNTRGELSGHRQRKVTGGATWHKERTKDVQGSDGGTFCSLSYGRKTDPSAKSIDRMGWCMVEYDYVAAGKKQDETAATAHDSSNYVLCKIYRSPRAKEKSASASSSSKKRKAGGGDHPEAPPAKSIQVQEPPQVKHQETAYCCYQPEDVQEVAVQVQPTGPDGDFFNFYFNIEDINFFVDESMQQQQPTIAELECGPVLGAEACTIGDGMLTTETVQRGDKDTEEFRVEWLLRGEPQQQQPVVEPPGHGGDEFIQLMSCGPAVPVPVPVPVPVVAEATLEDMLGLGPETTASIPWSSYAPTSSPSYTPCSSLLLQGPTTNPLRLPYLMC